MAWETDQPVINYLRRRVIYYEKKIGPKLTKKLQQRYGEEMVRKVKARIEARIDEYSEAIRRLETDTRTFKK